MDQKDDIFNSVGRAYEHIQNMVKKGLCLMFMLLQNHMNRFICSVFLFYMQTDPLRMSTLWWLDPLE